MNERDWEEFKKKVIPLEKENNQLKKNNEKIVFKKVGQEKKLETNFFGSEWTRRSGLRRPEKHSTGFSNRFAELVV